MSSEVLQHQFTLNEVNGQTPFTLNEVNGQTEFTPQQHASLELLKMRYSPDGSHDNLAEADPSVKSAPFAFDLGNEYRLSQLYGENYKKYFLENAHYYAKESYGRVPVSEYEHKIVTGEDGKEKLVLGPDNMSARESYLLPAQDATKPLWYQRRSMGDVAWVDNMERLLTGAEAGDTYLDFSPTEYDVSVSERKKWGYGYHSFVRLHKVVEEGGQKKLVSRAVRNYLDAPEQEELFKQLTGSEVLADEMLGRVERVNPDFSQAYIKALSQKLYDATPEQRKIIPPDEYLKNVKEEIEMEEGLKKIDTWLEVVYEMMQKGEDKSDILKKFRGWENAVKDYVQDKDNLERFSSLSLGQMRVALFQESSEVSSLLDRLYEAGSNGCGNGSGFAEIERNMTAMTYESLTKATEGECPEIKCRKCPWKASEKEANDISKGRIDKCPKCGWKP